MAKVDKRTISDNLDVEVTHRETGGYLITCFNKNTTAPLVVRVNFDNSSNVKAVAVPGAKLIGATVAELTIPPTSSALAVQLDPIDPAAPVSYKYTCATQLKKVAAPAAAATPAAATTTQATTTPTPAKTTAPAPTSVTVKTTAPAATPAPAKPAATAVKSAGAGVKAPPPEGAEETERKNLADGLEILIHSINNGYNLQIDNNADATYTVILDLEASENLVITAEGSATLDGKKITVNVPPKALVNVVNMPVDNWDLGSCELRYKAAIRKQ